MEKKEPTNGIRTLQRAIDILNCFAEDHFELTLTEIAKETGLAKSTTTRLLATLDTNHFVVRDPITSKYRLGRQLYFLGHVAAQSFELKTASESVMKNLRDLTKETVNLYILDGEKRICFQQYESMQSVKHMIRIGQKLPLHVGASGKVLLAYESEKFIDKVLTEADLPIGKSKADFYTELHRIVQEKYADSMEERETGTSAASSPIFDIEEKVVAALSISGPSSRFNPKEFPGLKKHLKTAAMEISENMGYIFKS